MQPRAERAPRPVQRRLPPRILEGRHPLLRRALRATESPQDLALLRAVGAERLCPRYLVGHLPPAPGPPAALSRAAPLAYAAESIGRARRGAHTVKTVLLSLGAAAGVSSRLRRPAWNDTVSSCLRTRAPV